MYESASEWNARHPPGTAVSINMCDGVIIEGKTASYAQQWGELAIVTLAKQEGLWTIGVLQTQQPA